MIYSYYKLKIVTIYRIHRVLSSMKIIFNKEVVEGFVYEKKV